MWISCHTPCFLYTIRALFDFWKSNSSFNPRCLINKGSTYRHWVGWLWICNSSGNILKFAYTANFVLKLIEQCIFRKDWFPHSLCCDIELCQSSIKVLNVAAHLNFPLLVYIFWFNDSGGLRFPNKSRNWGFGLSYSCAFGFHTRNFFSYCVRSLRYLLIRRLSSFDFWRLGAFRFVLPFRLGSNLF